MSWEGSSPPPQQLILANRQRQFGAPTPPLPSSCRCSHPRSQPWGSARSGPRRPAGSAQHPPPPAPEASGAAEAAPGANGQGGFRTTEPEQNPQEQQKSFPRASSARVRRLHEESCWPLRHFPGETPSPFLSSKPRCLQVTPRSLPPDHRRSRRGHLQSDHRRAGLALALLVAPHGPVV